METKWNRDDRVTWHERGAAAMGLFWDVSAVWRGLRVGPVVCT